MESNINQKKNTKKWIFGTIIVMALLTIIGMSRFFTEQNGTQSHGESTGVAKYIMETLMDNGYPINRHDLFWTVTADEIVRKMAHFSENLLIGLFLCALLNIIIKKIWLSPLIATVVCILLAYTDEFRQKFVNGRNPTWFDVRVDSYGAITGIIIATIFFIIYNKIKKLKEEIQLLEEKLGNVE